MKSKESVYCLVSEKSWHLALFDQLSNRSNEKWVLFNNKDQFTSEKLKEISPAKIFIPHWSYIIPAGIYSIYECVVFHMTDLPYGRGGSPLQNLIVRGHKRTKVSALRVNKGLDVGEIYLKRNLSLDGAASEIFVRSIPVIQSMIEEIIDKKINPKPQKGTPVIFKRRTPEDGKMNSLKELDEVYDYIRMLDAEGYPNAFIETPSLRFEFFHADFKDRSEVLANVRIIKK